jgi:ribonucleoside-diphosphate reductase alpha chain
MRLNLGKQHGFRKLQGHVIAPTGTIGLVMDCDTTGVEPDFALVKFKTLAGGGYFKIINRCVPKPWPIWVTARPRSTPLSPMPWATAPWKIMRGASITTRCAARGFGEEEIGEIEAALEAAFDIRFVFNKYTLGTSSAPRC